MKIKKLTLVILSQAATVCNFAQNVGIGTTQPMNKLDVVGSLLINAPLSITPTPPTPAQTYTMVNGINIYTTFGDSTGRIYDPGGPAGNYVSNLSATLGIEDPGNSGVALEITLEDVELGTGDSLILKDGSSLGTTLLAVGNGYNTIGKWIFNTTRIFVIFKSNSDANNGRGFSLLYRRFFDDDNLSPGVNGFAGQSLLFDAKAGALRSGNISLSPRGNNSFAAGNNVTASGNYSVSIGSDTKAIGVASLAAGLGTQANGDYSTAMGINSIANGARSVAIGSSATASGDRSTAMGSNTIASGDRSTALGSYVNTNNHNGAFLIGDNSTTATMNGTTPNNFRARFDGGYRFYTSNDYSSSCALSPGANAWSTTSDVNSKENFAALDGEGFLKKIAGFKLTSWNYKTQDPKTFRHYGPMAQDFFAAFGKDEYGTIGNDTTINSADFAGISFIAIQALEKRTEKMEQLEKENRELMKLMLHLKKETDELKKRIVLLENKKQL